LRPRRADADHSDSGQDEGVSQYQRQSHQHYIQEEPNPLSEKRISIIFDVCILLHQFEPVGKQAVALFLRHLRQQV